MNKLSDHRVIIASDVGEHRDGIGIEVYLESELVLEIFRDDTTRTRELTLFQTEVSLTLIEVAIAAFKNDIDWAFQD